MSGYDLPNLFTRLHAELRFVQAHARLIAERIEGTGASEKLKQELKAWAERTAGRIEKLFQEFDMGQAATVINGLLGQVSALSGQLAAAQANALDTADTAAIAAGQNELAAFQASQGASSASAPATTATAAGDGSAPAAGAAGQ